MIRFANLSFNYPDQEEPALKDLTLKISAGEFVLLAGPSGSGKSTLLRCVNGLVPHFSGGEITGTIRVASQDPIKKGPSVLSQVVGFVFQDPEAQAVTEVVESEMAFGLENAGMPRNEIRKRINNSLEMLGLEQLRDRKIASLSAGERQLVTIATVLVTNPEILILDEPTSQLDPRSAEEVLQAIANIHELLEMTIIISEHRLERLTKFTDRLLYLDQGKLIIDGPVREALRNLRREQRPPLTKLAVTLGWESLPVDIEEVGKETGGQDNIIFEVVENRDSDDSDSNPIIEVSGIHFSYDSIPVLSGIDLRVWPGELIVLIGRNGVGKSTLLKCIVGLHKPITGSIIVNGKSTSGLSVSEISRTIAYLPQNPDDLLYAETVEDELLVTLNNHRLSLDQLPIGPLQLLKQLGIVHHSGRYPRDLSVGERQRVALASIMITNPDVLILDEPTRGLDFDTKIKMATLWKKLQMKGTTLVVVTHDVELAGRVASRVIFMEGGKIIGDDLPQKILGLSPVFGTQISRMYPGTGWLTVKDVINALNSTERNQEKH